MKFVTPFILSLTSLTSLIAPAFGAGPSGTLTFPPGGTTFTYSPHGELHISYSQVSQANAQTLSVDVTLDALDDPRIAYGLSVNSKTAPITGWWTTIDRVPCNMHYQLVIHEWQLYNNEIISFQSAAPTIYIKC